MNELTYTKLLEELGADSQSARTLETLREVNRDPVLQGIEQESKRRVPERERPPIRREQRTIRLNITTDSLTLNFRDGEEDNATE